MCKKMYFLFLAPLVLSSCATNVFPQATGGSKADGTVVFAYEYGSFEKPIVDMTIANKTAIQRCKIWGYHGAEAFNGQQEHCVRYNGYGNCRKMQVNITYQCTDK
jgi:hypothetical protein